MKKIICGLIVLLVVWFGLIYFQQVTRFPVAQKLLNKKIEELKETPLEKLWLMADKGMQQENIMVNGVTYNIKYLVQTVDITEKEKADFQSKIYTDKRLDKVRVKAYADCVTVIPFTKVRIGPSVDLTIIGISE